MNIRDVEQGEKLIIYTKNGIIHNCISNGRYVDCIKVIGLNKEKYNIFF